MLQIPLLNTCPQQPGRLLQFPTQQETLPEAIPRSKATGLSLLLNTGNLPPAYETLVVRSPEDNLPLGIAKNELLIVDKVRRRDDAVWLMTDSNHQLKIVAPDNPLRTALGCGVKDSGKKVLLSQGLPEKPCASPGEEYRFLGSLVEVLPGAKGLRYAHNVKPIARQVAQGWHFFG